MRRKIFGGAILLFLVVAQAVAQDIKKCNFQIGFITPIGTNGIYSNSIINKVSINLLGGCSYGNTSAEFGGLYNVNTHLTKGVQGAGVLNYSGCAYNAVQLAGIANVAADSSVALQSAGILNIAKKVGGLQLAGIANIAKQVNGTQLSGIVNVADTTEKLQLAAVINVAKKNKGVQLALINYAEESSGKSIGLINIVKKNGLRQFELSCSEILNTAFSFKLGKDDLYTIFSAGINYLNNPVEYATGIGWGTTLDWNNNWSRQIEVMCYSITENGKFVDGTNLLTQLKYVASKKINDHINLFAGPTVNMIITDYVNPETGKINNSLIPYSIWKNNSEKVKLNAWIGVTAGIRL